MVLVARTQSVNPLMPFANRSLGGQWQFVMDNLGADCNGVAIENKRRNKGQFLAHFVLSYKPQYTECPRSKRHEHRAHGPDRRRRRPAPRRAAPHVGHRLARAASGYATDPKNGPRRWRRWKPRHRRSPSRHPHARHERVRCRARGRGRCPAVFTTAYDSHAVATFDAGAVDYLLKRVNAERLAQAVQRLQQRLRSAAPVPDIDTLLQRLAGRLQGGAAADVGGPPRPCAG